MQQKRIGRSRPANRKSGRKLRPTVAVLLRCGFIRWCASFTRQIRLLKSAASHSLIHCIRHAGRQLLPPAIPTAVSTRLSFRVICSGPRAIARRIRTRSIRRLRSTSVSLSGSRIICVFGAKIRSARILRRRGQLRERRHLQNHRNRARRHRGKFNIERHRNKTKLADINVITARRQRRKLEFAGLVRPARPALLCLRVRDPHRRAGNGRSLLVSNKASDCWAGSLRSGCRFGRRLPLNLRLRLALRLRQVLRLLLLRNGRDWNYRERKQRSVGSCTPLAPSPICKTQQNKSPPAP